MFVVVNDGKSLDVIPDKLEDKQSNFSHEWIETLEEALQWDSQFCLEWYLEGFLQKHSYPNLRIQELEGQAGARVDRDMENPLKAL